MPACTGRFILPLAGQLPHFLPKKHCPSPSRWTDLTGSSCLVVSKAVANVLYRSLKQLAMASQGLSISICRQKGKEPVGRGPALTSPEVYQMAGTCEVKTQHCSARSPRETSNGAVGSPLTPRCPEDSPASSKVAWVSSPGTCVRLPACSRAGPSCFRALS